MTKAYAALIAALSMLAVGCGPGYSDTCDPNALELGTWETASAEGSGASRFLTVSVKSLTRLSKIHFNVESNAEVVLLHLPREGAFDLPSLLASPLATPTPSGARRLSDPLTEGKITADGPLPEGELLFAATSAHLPKPLVLSAYISALYKTPPDAGSGSTYCDFPSLRPSRAFCGDGLRNNAEACDDGNKAPLDGCSACAVEPFTCTDAPDQWRVWRCAPASALGPDTCDTLTCDAFKDDCGAPFAATVHAATFGLQQQDADAGTLRYVGLSDAPQSCGGRMDSALAASSICTWSVSPCSQVESLGNLLGWRSPLGTYLDTNCVPFVGNQAICQWSDPQQSPRTATAAFEASNTAARWQHTLDIGTPILAADPRGGWALIGKRAAGVALDGAPLTLSQDTFDLAILQFDPEGALTSARTLPIQGVDVEPLAAAVTADGHLWLAIGYAGPTQLPSGAFLPGPATQGGARPVALLRMDLADDSLLAFHTTDPEQPARFDAAVLAFAPSPVDPAPGAALLAASDSAAGQALIEHLSLAPDPSALTVTWQAGLLATNSATLTAATFDPAGDVYIAGAAQGARIALTTSSQQIETPTGTAAGLVFSLSGADGTLRWQRSYSDPSQTLRTASLSWAAPDRLRYAGAFDDAATGGGFVGLALVTLDATNAEPLDTTPIADLLAGCGSLRYGLLAESAWAQSLADGHTALARSRCEEGTVLVSALDPDHMPTATEVLGDTSLHQTAYTLLHDAIAHPTTPADLAVLYTTPSTNTSSRLWQLSLLRF